MKKTTVEIADGSTGLCTVLDRERQPQPRFKLRDGSFNGDGMVKDFTWPEIRAIVYEGRGGE